MSDNPAHSHPSVVSQASPPLAEQHCAGDGSAAHGSSSPDKQQQQQQQSPPSPVVVDLTLAVLDTFSSPGLLLHLFRAQPGSSSTTMQQQAAATGKGTLLPHGLDLAAVDATYSLLLRSYAREVVSGLGSGALKLLADLPHSAAWASGASADVVALLLILLQVGVGVGGGVLLCC